VKVNGVVPALPSAALSVVAAIDSVGGGGASSFRIVAVAAAVPSVDPVGADSVTVNVSSGSTTVSPRHVHRDRRRRLAGHERHRPRRQHPAREVRAVAVPPVTAYDAEDAPDKFPDRVTVKVNGVVPRCPPPRSASSPRSTASAVAARRRSGSSPVAAAVPSVDPVGADSVTVKRLVRLHHRVAATFTVIVAVAWPATNDTVPDGSTPPAKSAAVAVRRSPRTTPKTPRTNSPTASTVKVNGVVPALPSAALSVVAAIDSVGGGGASSFRIVAVAAAVPSVDPVGADSVTVNVSSGSTTVSPATFTVIVAVAWPATNDTVPDGSTPAREVRRGRRSAGHRVRRR